MKRINRFIKLKLFLPFDKLDNFSGFAAALLSRVQVGDAPSDVLQDLADV